jgi:hypothetical protein
VGDEVVMGKWKENPRYNVMSCRANDAEWLEIAAAIGAGNRSAFFLEAVLEKVRRERSEGAKDALSSGV